MCTRLLQLCKKTLPGRRYTLKDIIEVDTKKRNSIALRILKQHKGRINNRTVAAQIRNELQLPPHWERYGEFVNSIRKEHKFPLPPRGGFRAKNGVERVVKHKIRPAAAPPPLRRAQRAITPTEQRDVAFRQVALQFAALCDKYNMRGGELVCQDGKASCMVLTEPQMVTIEMAPPE